MDRFTVVCITWLGLVIQAGQTMAQRTISRGFRPGSPTTTHSCSRVRGVPDELRSADVMRPKGLDSFYQKYTEAYGIPVLGSRHVQDAALKRACYLLRYLLAGHAPVRHMVYRLSGRLALIAANENAASIPEHKDYASGRDSPAYGAHLGVPVSSVKGTNILCNSSDSHHPESIGIHEVGHMIHLIGAEYAIPGWNDRLKSSYAQAKAQGLWKKTYAMTNRNEYFAEALQSYFNENWCINPPDGVHNAICTRAKLKDYDPQVLALIRELFPCNNTLLDRCNSTREQEEQQILRMDCVPYAPKTLPCPDSDVYCVSRVMGSEGRCQSNTHRFWTSVHCRGSCNTCKSTDPDCQDNEDNCPGWAAIGECKKNPSYMNVNCAYSCKQCTACEDKDDQCAGKALSGECQKNPTWMLKNCSCSCKNSSLPASNCTDSNDYCPGWAAAGECDKNPGYMWFNCRLSCKKCED